MYQTNLLNQFTNKVPHPTTVLFGLAVNGDGAADVTFIHAAIGIIHEKDTPMYEAHGNVEPAVTDGIEDIGNNKVGSRQFAVGSYLPVHLNTLEGGDL